MSFFKKRKISCRKSPGDIRTADENKAISSSVSCNVHKFFAKSNASFTRSSEPTGNTDNQVKFWVCIGFIQLNYSALLSSYYPASYMKFLAMSLIVARMNLTLACFNWLSLYTLWLKRSRLPFSSINSSIVLSPDSTQGSHENNTMRPILVGFPVICPSILHAAVLNSHLNFRDGISERGTLVNSYKVCNGAASHSHI